MNSKPATAATSHKSRVPYKFLTRNLNISDENVDIFQKICMKRVFIRKIMDKRRRGSDPDEAFYIPFKKNKLFKTLRTVQIPCIHQSYAHESIKSSKLLKSFSVDACSDNPSLQKVALYIKRFSITIRNLSLRIVRDRRVPHQSFEKLAKSIRILKNLENFKRAFILESRRPHLERELKAYSKSAERLKKLKKLAFILDSREQKEFQKTIDKNGKYPGITALKIDLQGAYFPDYERFERSARPENSDDEDKPSALEKIDPIQHQLFQMISKNLGGDGDNVEGNRRNARRNQNFFGFGDDDDDEEDEENDEEDDEDNEDDEEEEDEEVQYDDEEDDQDDGNGINRENMLAMLPFLMNAGYGEWSMREAIRSFYRFELFPDLKKLVITQDDQHMPLDSFVIDAFATLRNLEDFSITLHSRPKGSYNLFKGFLKFPQIRKFSLAMSFIKNNDWVLLQQFVKNQKNLEAFSLYVMDQTSTKARYLQQNVYFEELIKCLDDHPELKSLELRSEYWSLEALSKGLSHLTMVNQLKNLKFEGSDDTMTSDLKPLKRVEGLANFIKNQKDSLEMLGVFLPLVNEDPVVTYLAEAISKLSQLKELEFSVNSSYGKGITTFGRYSSEDFFQRRTEAKKIPQISEPWEPSVGEYFKKLENLEELWMRFDILKENSPLWFVDVMAALPSLEKLRDITILTSSGRRIMTEEDKIISAVEQLAQIRKIDLSCYDYPKEGKLKKIIEKVNERQSLKCDLMF